MVSVWAAISCCELGAGSTFSIAAYSVRLTVTVTPLRRFRTRRLPSRTPASMKARARAPRPPARLLPVPTVRQLQPPSSTELEGGAAMQALVVDSHTKPSWQSLVEAQSTAQAPLATSHRYGRQGVSPF